MAATDFFLFPVLPQTSSAGAAGVALHLLVYVTACAGVDAGGGSGRVYRRAFVCGVCVCLCLNGGCSQWPELEVIIMYRLVRCNANADAFSVAAVQVPVLY